MDILIYGEYSGLGKSLAKGFKEQGLDAQVFSPNGDNWKKIDVDIQLYSDSRIGKIIELVRLLPTFLQSKRVIIMNPYFISISLLGPLVILLFKLFRIEIYLLCCGADVEYIKRGLDGSLKRWVYNNIDLPSKDFYQSKRERFVHALCALSARKIIPIMYDYEYCWKQSRYKNKLTKVIPLACHLGKPRPRINKTDFKDIKIMHGISRGDIKGSKVILSALRYIQTKYEYVTVYSPEKLPQNEYLELFNTIDISIDQCKSCSYGMNGVYAMLHGHILLSSASSESKDAIGYNENPVIDILEDESVIIRKIEKLINNSEMDDLKIRNQQYAYDVHSPGIIAKKFITEVFS